MSAVLLRIIGFIVLIVIGAGVAMYLFTGNKRWLRWSWQVLKYALLVGAVALAFLALERLILAV
jgi:hypothetical protein